MTNEKGLNINWFPGHMKKAEREMQESLRVVDAVIEILDARIPNASRNPDLDEMIGSKPRLTLLNRADLADPVATKEWISYFESLGHKTLETNANSGKTALACFSALKFVLNEKIERSISKGMKEVALRAMVVGIPNVGKSTLINKLAKRKVAASADRPGVTRGQQWIRIDERLELLDTPGVLWPKFATQEVGELLAVTGAIKDEVLDTETLAANFAMRLMRTYPTPLCSRYKLSKKEFKTGFEILENAARNRGFLLRGGDTDIERMSATLLDEYRAGKLGRMTLERVNDL